MMDLNISFAESCLHGNLSRCNKTAIDRLIEMFSDLLWPKLVILFTLAALAITANGLLVYIIVSTPRLRTKSNTFVVALAITDFTLGFPSIPLHCAAEMGLLGR